MEQKQLVLLGLERPVLILVWVEYGLGVRDRIYSKEQLAVVLILVWVEYGLGDWYVLQVHNNKDSLNPCLGGIWSWRIQKLL